MENKTKVIIKWQQNRENGMNLNTFLRMTRFVMLLLLLYFHQSQSVTHITGGYTIQ